MQQHTNLSRLTDEELIRHAENERDPLVSSTLEIELCNRLTTLIENPPVPDDLAAVMEEYGFEIGNVIQLVKVASEFSCEDIKTLREKLARADKFYEIAADLQDDVLHRLNKLIQETI
jgi:hypothetical protein